MDSKQIIAEIEAIGWVWHSTSGSHRHFKHPTRKGKVTVQHPRKDIPIKTLNSIKRQAGL